jgi:hypothetical protein
MLRSWRGLAASKWVTAKILRGSDWRSGKGKRLVSMSANDEVVFIYNILQKVMVKVLIVILYKQSPS